MWFYSPKLTLMTLGFRRRHRAGHHWSCSVPFRRRLKALYEAEGQRQSMLVETIHGIRTIKSLAIEPQQQRDWEEKSAARCACTSGSGASRPLPTAIVQSLQTLMTVAIVAVGAVDVFALAVAGCADRLQHAWPAG